MKNRWFVDSSLLLIALIWGATFVLVQNVIKEFSPFAFLSLRFLLASGCMILFSLLFKYSTWNFKMIINGCILGTLLFSGFALQTWSLVYTTPGKSGFLTGLSVALVPIFLFLFYRVKTRPTAILGITCAVIGLYLLAFTDLDSVNIGDLLALSCAVAFGLHIVLTNRFITGGDPIQLVTVQFVTVAILSILSTILFEQWQTLLHVSEILQPTVSLGILVCSLLGTVLAYFGQTYFMQFTSPTKVAIIFATEPVFAALADYIWNSAQFTTSAIIGCGAILVGMLLAEIDFSPVSIRKKKIKMDIKLSKESLARGGSK